MEIVGLTTRYDGSFAGTNVVIYYHTIRKSVRKGRRPVEYGCRRFANGHTFLAVGRCYGRIRVIFVTESDRFMAFAKRYGTKLCSFFERRSKFTGVTTINDFSEYRPNITGLRS